MRRKTIDDKTLVGIIPGYAVLPMVLMLLINIFVYFGTRPFTDGLKHYNISCFIDYHIPFIPVFIVPYLLAYVQWITGYIAVARYNREYCYKVMIGEMISKIIVGIVFILFPTTMLREEIVTNDLFSNAVKILYKMDAPTNLFPSIHCLESYICMKAVIEMKNSGMNFRIWMIVMSILVFMSTLFIKQHVLLDFFGAVIIAEIGRRLSEYIVHSRLNLF